MGSELRTSVIRTTVPYIVGLVVTWLASQGISLDEAGRANFTAVVTFIVGSLYYTAARYMEERQPKFGWLLGKPVAPVYDTSGFETQLAEAESTIQGLGVALAAAEKAPAKKAPAKKAVAKKAAPVKKGPV